MTQSKMTTDLSLFGDNGLNDAATILTHIQNYGYPDGFVPDGLQLACDLSVPRVVLTNSSGQIAYLDHGSYLQLEKPSDAEWVDDDEQVGDVSIYTTDDGTDLEHAVLLVDGSQGLYTAQQFVLRWSKYITKGLSEDDKEILLAGPDHDEYVDCWGDVSGEIEMMIDDKLHRLYEEDDLWAVPTEEQQIIDQWPVFAPDAVTTNEELAESEGDSTGVPVDPDDFTDHLGRKHWVDGLGLRRYDGDTDEIS